MGHKDFGDLTAQQRAHLMQELGAELDYQRLKLGLALVQKVSETQDAQQAERRARAFESLGLPGPRGLATRGPGVEKHLA